MGNDLSREMTNRLLHEMRDGVYAEAKRLPPEIDLARQLGISRTLVRDCLAILEREGFINRKHGIGTVINHHVLNVRTRMDLEKEFLKMVEDAGYAAETALYEVQQQPADAQVAQRLELECGSMVYVTKRLITADGRPAIYCIDYISMDHILNEDYDEELLKKPIFIFLEKECGLKVSMDITEVCAVAADAELSQLLNVDAGSPVLYMDEVGYEFFGRPVLYSKEYYADGILKHMIVRKKI